MTKETLLELIGLALENKPEQKVGSSKQGEIKIVILQRGWVFVGEYYENGTECRLENASCIRNWGTTKGLGELAEDGPTSSTKLDPTPTVNFHKLTIVCSINCNAKKWNK